MKPKRQLPRTPPHANINSESDNVLNNVETPTEKIEQKDDIIPEGKIHIECIEYLINTFTNLSAL